ncbi:MAG: UDP-N-acetylmuramoyl-L-alanyl-D-glutamate--2,6-diaminopimelate ligase [Firmicutes bacterium]|nr:UDP-N-acetylmuramoyl-L-alanyl-D-glutamate--2,6-diaminopimelate ligase [Bacillota bacterium]
MASGIQRTDRGWVLGNAVKGVAIDSRMIRPGYVFVAIPGATVDGHQFIDDAIQRGAVAVVGERTNLSLPVPYFAVPSSREAAAELSAAFYRFPSRELTTVGVTGTNGKTSVVYWITALIRASGHSCGMISSVINETGDGREESLLTTPESPDLQRQLREMVSHGMTHAVIEISSHGIAQHRVDHVELDVAVLTNITREHLDFHGTMENYVATKSLLFERLGPSAVGAVINADDYYSRQVLSRIRSATFTYGLENGELRGRILTSTPWSSEVELNHPDFSFVAEFNHPGVYNVYNLLAAVSTAYHLGIAPEVIRRAIPRLPKVPGRMQILKAAKRPTVIIDYAHTPDGLMQSLKTVRMMTNGAVWLVFGARGGRDRGKRPEMGQIAAALADHVILTTDSPNDEDPGEIADAIAKGIRMVDGSKLRGIELSREKAIQWAISEAAEDDCVLVTGRGPEGYQNFHGKRVALSDAEVAQNMLRDTLYPEGVDGVGIH